MDDNIERYDRQIRLWGQHGQNKCSEARVCLINANSLGAEILKGLCLAGIASFTILDSLILTPEDAGSIFVRRSCVGKNRGDSVKQMLLLLNPDVTGEVHPIEKYLPQNPIHDDKSESDNEFTTDDTDFWRRFDVVIISGFLSVGQIIRLSRICWTLNIPLLICKSIGFFGSMRCQIQEHLVIETHPDHPLPDFSLDRPFSDLKDYLESVDFDDTANIDKLNSLPYLVIVYHYLKKWQSLNNFPPTRLPDSHSEKTSLRNLITEGFRQLNKVKRDLQRDKDSAYVPEHEVLFENFIEAGKAIMSCFSVTSKVPTSVERLFNHEKALGTTDSGRSTFWSIIAAVKEFVSRQPEPRLPISGTIPDMTSSSEEYIRVQNIYAKKARLDVDDVFSIVQNLINASSSSPGQSLYEETKLICKNIRDLRIVGTSQISEEYDFKSSLVSEDEDDDESIAIALGLKALDLFYSTYGRLPGRMIDQVETDIAKLKGCLKQIVGRTSNKLKTLDQCLYELCRCGGAEIHATSAFLGGCIAQEAIKFITNQYLPIDDTLIHNAMTATTRTFKFDDAFLKQVH